LFALRPELASLAAEGLFPILIRRASFSTENGLSAQLLWCYSRGMKKLALAALLLMLFVPSAFASSRHHHHRLHHHAAHHRSHRHPA
jgi:hypothetical protein